MKKRLLALVSLLLCAAMLMATACTGGKNSETDAATGENDPTVPLPAWDMLSAYDPDGSDFRLSVDAKDEVHDISELLFGIFFEDNNYFWNIGGFSNRFNLKLQKYSVTVIRIKR